MATSVGNNGVTNLGDVAAVRSKKGQRTLTPNLYQYCKESTFAWVQHLCMTAVVAYREQGQSGLDGHLAELSAERYNCYKSANAPTSLLETSRMILTILTPEELQEEGKRLQLIHIQRAVECTIQQSAAININVAAREDINPILHPDLVVQRLIALSEKETLTVEVKEHGKNALQEYQANGLSGLLSRIDSLRGQFTACLNAMGIASAAQVGNASQQLAIQMLSCYALYYASESLSHIVYLAPERFSLPMYPGQLT